MMDLTLSRILLLIILNCALFIKASAQQVGMSRKELYIFYQKEGITVRKASLFTEENASNDLVASVKEFGNIEFVFNENDLCHTVIYAPKDMEAAKFLSKKLSTKFLTLDDKVWNGVENEFVVEIKIYYTNKNSVLFVKKGVLD